MKYLSRVRYWTMEELRELIATLNESQHGIRPVLYHGQLVRFKGVPTITFHGKDMITVEGLDMEIMETAEQENIMHQHDWVDISTYGLEANKKRECCLLCGDKKIVNR